MSPISIPVKFVVIGVLFLLMLTVAVEAAPKRKALEKKTVRELKEFVSERRGSCVGCFEKRHLVDEAMAVRRRQTTEEQLVSDMASTPGMYLHPSYVMSSDIEDEQRKKQRQQQQQQQEGTPNPCVQCFVTQSNGTQTCVDTCARI
eukprot:TRINITY_DN10041_c0_g1_i1.p1 TRINITY_DN10041_c0_g1~~TRINITY_DN10041_c0_g1_i1.p1  ORF type:complete len:166 (+),score=36.31 TRINITY_DN10041_c0_g1_i1:62-499(+)